MIDYQEEYSIVKSWRLEDGQTLEYYELKKVPFRHAKVVACYGAHITDGINKYQDFLNNSGKIRLSDGRIAYVDTNKYLRIVDSSNNEVEIFEIGCKRIQ